MAAKRQSSLYHGPQHGGRWRCSPRPNFEFDLQRKKPVTAVYTLRPTARRRSRILCGLRCRAQKRYVSIRQRPGHRSARAAGSNAGDSDS